MSDAETISIEVVYAMPDQQSIVKLTVPQGTTALAAAQQSGLDKQFDDLNINEDSRLGIFGQLTALTRVLRDGDRVEIYRPLLADPKEIRKERAARAKARREHQPDD
ncbi:MAG: putative ubiquitin-RnfH superfamily antitoxin RatB of RatAB toxin-antitoxin module [Glaciecola sp.]|jgi:putative ubiquitin-RnfH superfamily antitoxin RatB of RatAB toxin-antitoxin module|uniref:RnfH family protein n=1 Tax=Congregibacter sp. TaxID=2744308 RepID=UPI0039E3FC1A